MLIFHEIVQLETKHLTALVSLKPEAAATSDGSESVRLHTGTHTKPEEVRLVDGEDLRPEPDFCTPVHDCQQQFRFYELWYLSGSHFTETKQWSQGSWT